MWSAVISMLLGQPKVKASIEQIFGQPADHVAGCFGRFMENVKKGPGLQNSVQEKQRLFDRYYQGGMSMGFKDWESYIAAAKLSGYSTMDVCYSFRKDKGWDVTTDKINELTEKIMPSYIEKGKETGLLPPEQFPDKGIPQTLMNSSGGLPPWDKTESRPGANGIPDNINNAPMQGECI
jgi:hypothetical protein